MEILKLVITDDDQRGLDALTKIVGSSPNLEIVFISTDPVLALEFVEKNPVDILITDIIMDKMHGIQLASKVQKMNIPVIICSAYEEYAFDGYQVDAVHFIKKPATPSSFFRALEKVVIKLPKPPSDYADVFSRTLAIHEHGSSSMSLIDPDHIMFMRSEGNYVEIVTTTNKYVILISLSSIMERLPHSVFYRVHKSFAVNLAKIQKIKLETIYLEGGAEVPLGRSYSKVFHDMFRRISLNGTSSNVSRGDERRA
jgi:DNA-binding LytR/AlgR family response regulator